MQKVLISFALLFFSFYLDSSTVLDLTIHGQNFKKIVTYGKHDFDYWLSRCTGRDNYFLCIEAKNQMPRIIHRSTVNEHIFLLRCSGRQVGVHSKVLVDNCIIIIHPVFFQL